MSLILEKPEEFKFILRILNTNIDGKRKVPFGIRMIKGVGRRFSTLICKIARINPSKRCGELTEKETQTIQDIIADPVAHNVPRWFLNRQNDFRDGTFCQAASNVLETKLRDDLERMKKARSHRGLRHYWGLKVRGQHTKSTGRRGATLGVQRKK